MGNKTLCIVDNGQSEWKIVVGTAASPSEKHAGEELQYFIKLISGVELPIIDDSGEVHSYEILVGSSSHVDRLGLDINYGRLGNEGYVIQTKDRCIIITGGHLRGTLYGVYTFLEEYLGCKWFSSKVSKIPEKRCIEIPEINDEQIPVLEYRDVFYYDAFDPDWCVRNKCNGNTPRLEAKHGGKVKYSHFVHTFDQLVPASVYFSEHPEYFSEIDGKRTIEKFNSQLCLSNPDVFRITVEKVKEWIRADPEATIISVSQNDGSAGCCQCSKCRALDEQEGSPSGSLLYFVNRVAEEVEKEYPNVSIDTLAYAYTRKPPLNIKPRDNVIIRLCSIECCFSHPFDTCNYERESYMSSCFTQDIKAWSKISKRLYVWDYVTNFPNFIMPFPNMRVLQPNMRFLVKNNVKGVFAEGNYSEGGGGEFAELRAYLLAKLMWNPECDIQLVMDEFMEGYYGRAAAPIKEYINLLHDKVEKENIHVTISDPPTASYLSEELITRAQALFDEAELFADDAEILERVRIARLPVEFVKLYMLPLSNPARSNLVSEFFSKLKKEGITKIKETRTLDESYKMVQEGSLNTF